jgi:hypothetical protein
MKRTRCINDIGIGFKGTGDERMVDIRVYPEGGGVLVWPEIRQHGVCATDTLEAVQYLTAEEAMAFAKAFERCAIQALKDSA